MKFIITHNAAYVRHWRRWYWLDGDIAHTLVIKEEKK